MLRLHLMAGSLDSAWAKWRRGREYYEALNAGLEGASRDYPWTYVYRATAEVQPGGLEYRFYVDPGEFDAETPALIAGDCVFNLRAALDHLIYALHDRRFRGQVPGKIGERTQFPILTRHRRDKRGNLIPSIKWAETGSLSARQRTAIEFLQPYNRRHDKLMYTRERLADLALLNNIDKHRYLHVARIQSIYTPVPWPQENNPYGFRYQSFFVPLEGKTEVFRWFLTVVPPDIAKQVQMHSEIRAAINLYERGEGMALVPLLQAIVNAVEVVLKRFERIFR
jgi:hypothetical protein